MFTSTASHRARPKAGSVLAYAICPVLLATSFYGCWRWFELSANTGSGASDNLFCWITLAVFPLIALPFLAAWIARREAGTRIAASYQMRIDQLQKRLNTQEDFLHVITDHDPSAIAVFDSSDHYWFANLSTARFLGVDARDVIGAPIAKFFSPDRARKLEKRLAEVRGTGRTVEALHEVADKSGPVRFMRTHYEPIQPFGDFAGGVIVRAEDVTTLIVERKRRENMLRQVIATLVAIVDRRDPYATGHSSRVGQLSRALAEEMVLDEQDIEATEIAGTLMNFGKILVPREILTKTGALTPEELQRVRDSILSSADILSIIDFVGPVVPTLRQVLERFDGAGVPRGLKGDQILMTARIVTVANAYVALVSSRAHRPNMGLEQAIQSLTGEADKIYDRRVVTTLANYVKNRANKLDWLTADKPV